MKKEIFILTGYDKIKNKLSTSKYYDIDIVISIIKHYTPDLIPSENDFKFELKTARNHVGYIILDSDDKYLWSIAYI